MEDTKIVNNGGLTLLVKWLRVHALRMPHEIRESLIFNSIFNSNKCHQHANLSLKKVLKLMGKEISVLFVGLELEINSLTWAFEVTKQPY